MDTRPRLTKLRRVSAKWENTEAGNEWSSHSLVLVEKLHKRMQLATTSAALWVPLGSPGAAGGSVWLPARLGLCPGPAQVSVLSISNVGVEGNRSMQLVFISAVMSEEHMGMQVLAKIREQY